MRRHFVLFQVLGWAVLAWADGTATAYRVETIAGNCPIGGGPATAAEIGTINGVAVDRSGNFYLSDTDNHLVRKVSAAGTISTLAGTCSAGYSGDGGPAAIAQLNQPYGVAADAAGNVYVADYGNNRVRRIGTDGTITTVAGNGQAGQVGDGGAAVDAQLLHPRNVAVDAIGNLYFSEFEGHRVRKVSPDGKISTAAGIGIAGYGGDAGPAIAAQLDAPAGLAVDRMGALYIADSKNHRIRKVQGGAIVTVLGPTVRLTGGGTTPVYGAIGVTVDAGGTIYVAQGLGGGGLTVGVYNTTEASWTSIVAASSEVSANDVAVDASGNLYLAGGTQIWESSPGLAGTASYPKPPKVVAGGSVGDGGSATAAQLLQPWAVALDRAGSLHIADTLNHRVRKVNGAGQIATEAGTGTSGYSGDGSPAAIASLGSPAGVATDTLNNIFIADRESNRIRQVGADGRIKTAVGCDNTDAACQGLGQEGLPAGQMPLSGPQGVCTDDAGVLYVVDTFNHRVLRAASGARMFTAAGNGSQGYSGDGYLAQLAQLNQPTACALDSAGNLFIADTGNHTIRKVTPDGMISTVAGTGASGSSGDGGPATSALLYGPAGIAADDGGNLYVSDTNNHRVRKVTPDGVIQTIAGADSAVPIRYPKGLALDGSGNLYFADSANNLVRRLVPGTSPASGPGGTTAANPIPLALVNAASLQAGPVAPGELISILGKGLGPQVGVPGNPDATGLIPTMIGGTEVHFDGAAAPVLYAQASQVNVQVPYSVAGTASTKAVVLYNGQQAGAAVLPVVSASPAIFPTVANQDGSINSQSQPAPKNSIIMLYATGEGLTNGPNLSGRPAVAPYAQPVGSVALTVGGMSAQILYAGSAPGLVGVLQINARTPGGFIPSGQAALVLTVGGASSPPLTIWLE